MKLEHIGIAVKDLTAAEELYKTLLKVSPYKREKVEREGVQTSFFLAGESKVELLEALGPDSPIQKFIDKRGEGIHHIAFEVEDIQEEMHRMQKAGYQPLHDAPRKGADNKWVCFFHPKDFGGVLIELCQSRDGS